jgi:hypothetical protein
MANNEQIHAWHETARQLANMAKLRMVETRNPLDFRAGALWSAADWLTNAAEEAAVEGQRFPVDISDLVAEKPERTIDHWRNRLAQRVCNSVLNHVATPDYRNIIDGAIRLGLGCKCEAPGVC